MSSQESAVPMPYPKEVVLLVLVTAENPGLRNVEITTNVFADREEFTITREGVIVVDKAKVARDVLTKIHAERPDLNKVLVTKIEVL